MRLAAPRFAGIGSGAGGRVTITAANATVSSGLAWVLVDYRWISSTEQRAEVGRATVICERRGSGWKIVHAHSSQPLPWDP
jgi:ketosteroid isomerase-like protein